MTAGLADRFAIAVMAKAPAPGRTKTRLSPPLSPDAAAMMARAFLRDVTANLAAAARQAPIDPFVAYAPAGAEALFDGLLEPGTDLILADGTDGEAPGVERFGRSLLHAARALFARGYGAVGLLNADSPTLPTDYLLRAAHALAPSGDRAAIGPADDGGYWLLAMKAPHPELFAHIAWSTSSVAAETRGAAHILGLDMIELPAWYDVDDAASLARLTADLDAAPATAACLASLNETRAA